MYLYQLIQKEVLQTWDLTRKMRARHEGVESWSDLSVQAMLYDKRVSAIELWSQCRIFRFKTQELHFYNAAGALRANIFEIIDDSFSFVPDIG